MRPAFSLAARIGYSLAIVPSVCLSVRRPAVHQRRPSLALRAVSLRKWRVGGHTARVGSVSGRRSGPVTSERARSTVVASLTGVPTCTPTPAAASHCCCVARPVQSTKSSSAPSEHWYRSRPRPRMGGATVLKVGGQFCERSEKIFFDPPLFGQWGGQNIA